MRSLVVFLLRLYQKFVSPTLGSGCRYYPSCSQYAIDAVEKYGIGSFFLIIKRIIRCSPLSSGGFDPVPNIRRK